MSLKALGVFIMMLFTSPALAQVATDAINLSQAAVYNSPRDIASWPITTAITRLEMQPLGAPAEGLSFEFSARSTWPDYTPPGWDGPIQYTVWAVMRINGQWVTSGFIQMWRDRGSTGAPLITDFARNWAYDGRWGPMAGYNPHAGEQVGFFVSAGNARGPTTVTSVRERSNVVVVNLPANDTGVFTFAASSAPSGDLQTLLFNLNGDAYKDLLLYSRSTGGWAAKLGTAAGTFVEGLSGGWSAGWDIKAADFNGDGLDDLFLYHPLIGTYYKVINTGGTSFTYFTQGWQPGFQTFIVDLNGDHKADVFLYNPVNGTWYTCVSTGTGTGGFSYRNSQWAPGWQVLPADFNGDGRTDVLLYNRTTGLYYKAISQGDGTFSYPTVGTWAPGWTPLIVDLNGDGRSDVFLYNSASGLWYRSVSVGDGTLGFTYTVGQWAPDWSVHVAEFNADGKSDLFLYNTVSGVWYEAVNNGSTGFNFFVGTWGRWETTPADLNGDGKSDLFLYGVASRFWYQAFTTSVGSFAYTSGTF